MDNLLIINSIIVLILIVLASVKFRNDSMKMKSMDMQFSELRESMRLDAIKENKQHESRIDAANNIISKIDNQTEFISNIMINMQNLLRVTVLNQTNSKNY